MAHSQVALVIAAFDRTVEKVVAKITLDVTANLIESTPVDTGWARANWVPAIGTPFIGQVGSREQVSASQQQSGVAAIATSYKLELGSVFISNNVPYIIDLNDGSSTQAPAGFVEDAISKALVQDLLSLAGSI